MSTSPSAPIALITGANRTDGLGYATARQLALQHGFTVILGSRILTPAVDDAVKQLVADGAKNGVHALQIDIASSDSVKRAAEEVSEKFGRLDVLVNNAALSIPSFRTELIEGWPNVLLDSTGYTRKDFENIFAVNVFGIVETINAFVPLLSKSSAPRIVNVTSGVGSLGYMTTVPAGDMAASSIAYSTSKAALNMLTIMYSKDLPKKNPAFKINAGCPGFADTSLNKHLGTRLVTEACAVITHLATLPEDGPTGGFFVDYPPYSEKLGDFKPASW